MKSRFVQCVGDSYKIIRGFISPEEAARQSEILEKNAAHLKFCGKHTYIDACKGVHQDPPALAILCEKVAELNELLGVKVIPTYSYSRIYGKGGMLLKHTDRESCEITLTVHLHGDESWDLAIHDINDEVITVTLDPGDAILFDGHNFPHYRVGRYNGYHYNQLFLHYIFSDGNNLDHAFDRSVVAFEEKSAKNYIKCWHNALNEEACKKIISYAEPMEWKPAGTVNEDVPGESGIRVCDTVSAGDNKEFDEYLYPMVNNIIQKYMSEFPHLRLTHDEGYNILRYNPGGKYDVHTDHGSDHNRAITIIFNLNDDYTGGDLSFFDMKHTIQMKTGTVVVFPSSFVFDHTICPILSGTRYSMVTWAV